MTIKSIIRSPLLHFFILGGLVFGLYALMNPPGAQPPRDDVLRFSETEADRLADAFTAAWGRPPTEAEARGLVRDWAVEEAMVREALTLGLDQGDAIIRNRLRTKMEFLAEAPAAAMTPDDETLRAFYDDNRDRYARPAMLGFAQVLLPEDADAEEIDALRAALAQGADPSGVGQATMLPPSMDGMPVPAIERVFGGGFGAAVAALPPQLWSGPVTSGYGRHLVMVQTVQETAAPALDTVRDRVLADWRSEQARKMRAAYTDGLLRRYTLDLPGEDGEERP
ncbi:peptidylprolyl isomerase [Sedimentitalea sp. JM2-8]|uniref:Peptidylprolyl isomerase n=1 Tax=Sedimentitalea xiamensis TaxID=3050037 RepID=A0ABT7FIS3_9RHOB|nr:peptidylprolyl isomerase [Sedimentitalea xiamensis]MDK3075041.1 peptidylprolyl isomerase [Sedimentitalea xiamensis]